MPTVDKNIKLTEHEGVAKSYMEKQHLRSLKENTEELDELITDQDDLPQWASAKINSAEDLLDSVNEYVKDEKTVKALHIRCNMFFKFASKYVNK
jgi:hypothetical protein